MKDLLNKEHYCYNIHTLLMKSSAYLLFYRQPLYMGYTPSAISRAILKPVYQFGIPNSDPQTLKSVKINSSENSQMAVYEL